MNTSIKSYANLGLATISVANSNLNGSGTIVPVIVGTHTGTVVRSIIIKAQGNTTEGMVRLFIDDTSNISLYREVRIPASVQSLTEKSFSVTFDDELLLDNGYTLYAATQNGDTFNVIAKGISYFQNTCSSSANSSEPKHYANTGIIQISTANANLDGSGTLGTVLTAGNTSSVLDGGTLIGSVNIKAIEDTNQDMVRLFVYNGTTSFLVEEIPIAGTVQTSLQPAYRTLTYLDLFLNPSYQLRASTAVGQIYNIVADGMDTKNCDY